MNFRTRSVLSVMLVLLCVGSFATAQEKLPMELIGANASLDGAQQRTLDEFAKFWIDNMQSSADPQVSDARDNLISPLKHPSAGSVFKSAYSATLTRLLPDLLKNDRMLVRFNAMLCVPSLLDKSAINMIQSALRDTNPAIRYLAAQAAGKMGKNLQADDQMRILTLIQNSFVNEPDQVVVEQLLESMSLLTVPQARLTMLEALNMHADVHHGNPNLTLKADRDAMLTLLKDIVREQTDGKKIDFRVSKQFAVAACRFMIHCSRALDEDRVHSTMQAQYSGMIQDCVKILVYISTRPMGMEEKVLPQDDTRPNLQAQRWTAVRLRAEEWRKTLQDPPYNTALRDLAVPSRR